MCQTKSLDQEQKTNFQREEHVDPSGFKIRLITFSQDVLTNKKNTYSCQRESPEPNRCETVLCFYKLAYLLPLTGDKNGTMAAKNVCSEDKIPNF